MISVVQLASGAAAVACGDVPTGGLAALTVEGWFRVFAISSANRPLLGKYGPDGHEWVLYVSKDGRAYCVVFNGTGANVAHSAIGVIGYNRWTHVAGCYDGSHIRIFVDGGDVTQVSRLAGGTVTNTVQAVRLGGFIGEAGSGFTGRLGWARVSDVCRYPGAPTPLALRGVDQAPVVDANTLAQWNMAEGSGTTVDNAQGNAAYDGVISGGVWAPSVTSDKVRALPIRAARFGGRGLALGAAMGVAHG